MTIGWHIIVSLLTEAAWQAPIWDTKQIVIAGLNPGKTPAASLPGLTRQSTVFGNVIGASADDVAAY
jgi:hypothetical protein